MSSIKFVRREPPVQKRRITLSGLLVIYVPAFLVLAATVWANLAARVPISFFSLDATSTLDGHPLTGAQSTLGVLALCAAGGICFFSCAAARRMLSGQDSVPFLFWSGVIATVLALDDMFLVHEDLAGRYLLLKEQVVFLAYASLLAWYLIRFRRNILKSEYGFLVLALALMGSSLVVDLFKDNWPGSGRMFLEGATKFLGIVTWSAYLIRVSFRVIAQRVELTSPNLVKRAEADQSVQAVSLV